MIAALIALAAAGAGAQDALRSGFENPPMSARPLVWWHWMGGNISKEGVQLDVEWMHRAGLGGFQAFQGGGKGMMGSAAIVTPPVSYLSAEWKEAFKTAVTLGQKYGMEMAIAGSPGWSESGGPWVAPKDAMKKLVWSEVRIKGGETFHGQLPQPPTATGPFQNFPVAGSAMGGPSITPPEYYADSEVIAFKVPAGDIPVSSVHPKVTTSGGEIDLPLLTDGDLIKTVTVQAPPGDKQAWIQYEFAEPQTIHAVTLQMGGNGGSSFGVSSVKAVLEASDDGSRFHKVADIAAPRLGFAPNGNVTESTIAFAPVSARFYRIVFPSAGAKVAELVLHPGARVNLFEVKDGFSTVIDPYSIATPRGAPGSAIAKGDVINLTGKMQPDGTLNWTPPSAGDWVILRFGYSLTGAENEPAPVDATGLEADKLDRAAVRAYMEHYLDRFKEALGPDQMGEHGLHHVINDSWEAGNQNWTTDMVAKFTRLRGYDPRPWMPVLAGHVVDSAESSDRFLWDFRETIASLIATEHYGELEDILHERHMAHYSESQEDHRAFVADGMQVKKYSEVPMGAYWTRQVGSYPVLHNYNADDRESASTAHIYGRKMAAAESLTAVGGAWRWSPETLKPAVDQEFLNGINRIAIHESTHQPLIGKAPGFTLGPVGQWFNRNETWADQAGAWIDYLARCSFLLQQGHFGADILYFYGEDSNLTGIFGDKAPDVPAGYGFDYINADALIHELAVTGGRITTKSGMSYRILALDEFSRNMSLPVLKSIASLVKLGAVVAGTKPSSDPSLADDQAEFARLSSQLFGDGTGVHHFGKGTLYAGQNAADALKALQVASDFDYTRPQADTHMEFVHRKLADGDLYFVDNRSDRAERVDAIFRVTGKSPELWRAETGSVEPVSYRIDDGHTTVPLQFEPWGSVFVVFRKPATHNSRTLPAESTNELATLQGPWTISFQKDRGAPPSITLDKLTAWNQNSDPGVKHFSGTATYTNTVNAPAQWFQKGTHLYFDMGSVKNLAEVIVNGKSLGIVWHEPFRVDVTGALKPGLNNVTVKVTNSWVNRLIGDEQPNVTEKITFTTFKAYGANSTLLDSGLLGPVRLLAVSKD
jgi:hypothetical protein